VVIAFYETSVKCFLLFLFFIWFKLIYFCYFRIILIYWYKNNFLKIIKNYYYIFKYAVEHAAHNLNGIFGAWQLGAGKIQVSIWSARGAITVRLLVFFFPSFHHFLSVILPPCSRFLIAQFIRLLQNLAIFCWSSCSLVHAHSWLMVHKLCHKMVGLSYLVLC